MKKRVAVLISGRGSNMESLIAASLDKKYPAQISLVLSNNPDAYGLITAKNLGVTAYAMDHRKFKKDRGAHECALNEILKIHNIDIVCLAGYMRILTPFLVGAWTGRMLNIHPSLLPAYKGLHTHARAIADGMTEHGCTVHYVTEKMDDGPIIAQARVPVYVTDNEDTLAARVLEQEHLLYPKALSIAASK